MVQNSLTARIAGRAVKIGNSPIAAWILALAAVGTYFGSNLVNDKLFAGVCAQDRCQVVAASESIFATGSTVNTLWLGQPFGSGATAKGYRTGTGVNTSIVIDLVTNNNNASFDCYLGRKNTATGATGNINIATNLTGTGKIVKFLTGSVLGPDMGFGCNTAGNIKSNTKLEAIGVFVNSTVLN